MGHDAGDTGVKKRSVTVNGHATSIALEGAFWHELQSIAARRGTSVNQLVTDIDDSRTGSNLSSAIRVFILANARKNADG